MEQFKHDIRKWSDDYRTRTRTRPSSQTSAKNNYYYCVYENNSVTPPTDQSMTQYAYGCDSHMQRAITWPLYSLDRITHSFIHSFIFV